jgi:hypothetical protein
MVFFLGAGASRASPSCLPIPEEVQRAVLEQVAPRDAEAVEENAQLEKIGLPELYHEILLHLGGPDAREIWRCLDDWREPPLAKHGLGPNPVHHLVVYLAWRSRTPVVTVNFDQMLEQAARELNLEPRPRLGDPTDETGVGIWKLHGSTSDPDGIRTTVQSITASAPRDLRRIEEVFKRAQGCLVGYSGRDIDFFPFLCEWSADASVYWLDPFFGKGHRYLLWSDPFIQVKAKGEEWARRTVDAIGGLDPRSNELRRLMVERPLDWDAVRDDYAKALRRRATDLYPPMFEGEDAKRSLIQALALASMGERRLAARRLGRFASMPASDELRARGLLLEASLAHEQSRFLDSGAAARQARELARGADLRDVAFQATISADEAGRMANSARFPFVTARETLTSAAVRNFAAMVLHAIRYIRFGRLRHRDRGASPDYDRVRATFAYLEHLVRIGAWLQGFAERVGPDRFVGGAFRPWWRAVEALSHRAGYAFGIGNAKKYMLRAASDEARKEALSAFNVYDLVVAQTGLAIDARDRADAEYRAASVLPPGPERNRREKTADKLYDEALKRAKGNASLELKIMVGMKTLNPSHPFKPDVVDALLDQAQGPAHDRIRTRLRELLLSS